MDFDTLDPWDREERTLAESARQARYMLTASEQDDLASFLGSY